MPHIPDYRKPCLLRYRGASGRLLSKPLCFPYLWTSQKKSFFQRSQAALASPTQFTVFPLPKTCTVPSSPIILFHSYFVLNCAFLKGREGGCLCAQFTNIPGDLACCCCTWCLVQSSQILLVCIHATNNYTNVQSCLMPSQTNDIPHDSQSCSLMSNGSETTRKGLSFLGLSGIAKQLVGDGEGKDLHIVVGLASKAQWSRCDDISSGSHQKQHLHIKMLTAPPPPFCLGIFFQPSSWVA